MKDTKINDERLLIFGVSELDVPPIMVSTKVQASPSNHGTPRVIMMRQSSTDVEHVHNHHSWPLILTQSAITGGSDNMTLLRSQTGCYQVIEQLGRGTFGNVLKAQKKETGKQVAIKVIKNDPIRSRVIKNEIRLLNVIRHVDVEASHLIRFFEHFHVQDTYYLVFELLQQSLYDYQKMIRFAPVPLGDIRTITGQVLQALSKLKELCIIHSDLKPENIVLVDQVRYPFRVKVVDFGSASILPEVKHCKAPYIQSRFYRAPEILLGLPFSEKLDMWSLGCIMAELHFGYPLYPGSSEYDQIRYICETHGIPENYLLNAASKARSFFRYKLDTQRRIQWRIKTEEEYQLTKKVKSIERRKFFLKSLDEIELLYTPTLCYHEVEVLAEIYDLENMVKLMKRMLTWDSNKRITPNTAMKHPFISLQNWKTHYKNTKYYQLSKQCQYDATGQEPPRRHLAVQSSSCCHGQTINIITDGEKVEKTIEQISDLHIEQPAEEPPLKNTDKATYHPEPPGNKDLQYPCHSTGDTEGHHSRTQLTNYHTSNTSKAPEHAKTDGCSPNLVFIGKRNPDPAGKHGKEQIDNIDMLHSSPSGPNKDHEALKEPETSEGAQLPQSRESLRMQGQDRQIKLETMPTNRLSLQAP